MRQAFGVYSTLLLAAGIKQEKPKKITNEVFVKNLEKHLENYQPIKGPPPIRKATYASISDIHWPFENQKVIDAFYKYIELKQPEWVILNGDALDMYSHSKYPRSHNVFTPREEQALGRKANEIFWETSRRLCPNAKHVQLLGNHDQRSQRRVLESYPEVEDWLQEAMEKLFTFPGVRTVFDPREPLMIDPVTAVMHGFLGQLGAHRDMTLLNTVVGHTHRGGTVFRRVGDRTISETNSGLAGDPNKKGLTYTPSRITGWTPGFAARDEWGDRFIVVD